MSFIRKSAIALGATAAMAGGAGAYVYFQGLPGSGGGDGLYGSAEIIPDEAMGAVALANNAQAWKSLDSFGSSAIQAQADQELQNFKQSFLKDTGLSLDEDILPLLDGVVVALLPPTTVESADAPELLAVVSSSNPLKALKLLTKAKDGGEIKIETSDHKGVKLSEMTTAQGSKFYSAVLKQRLVLSPTRRPVEMAIETSQGGDSLADLPQAAQALKGNDDSVLRLYIPNYGELVTNLMTLSPDAAPLSPEAMAQMGKVKSIVASLAVEQEGLRFQAASALDPSLRPADLKPGQGDAVKRFPANTVAFFNGQGIGQSWGKLTEESAALPESSMVFDLMRSASQQVNVDLDKDVFGWMTGEYAFGIVPVQEGLVGQVGMGAAFVLDSGDRPTTEAFFGKLDKLATGNQFKVAQKNLGKQAITAWQAPMGSEEAIVGRGWIDKDSMFLATGDSLIASMSRAPAEALPSNAVYRAVMAELPKNAMGYGFVNVEQALALALNSPLSSQVDPQAAELLRMVEGIGMASVWEKAETSEVELFISLKSQAELEAAAVK
jgi:hypothetical protein